MGPLLLVIYINDWPLVTDPLPTMFLLADDTKVCRRIATLDDIKQFQEDSQAMQQYIGTWLLRFQSGSSVISRVGKLNRTVASYTMASNNELMLTLKVLRANISAHNFSPFKFARNCPAVVNVVCFSLLLNSRNFYVFE